MRTLVLDPPPPALVELLDQRRRAGADRRDEVWEGVLHMGPPPSYEHERLLSVLIRLLGPYADDAGLELTGGVGLGQLDDFRVPDLALHRPGAAGQWQPTAALVVEIVSPDDQSWEKLDFYAAHLVDEVVIVDPSKREAAWLGLDGERYGPVERSRLIELARAELVQQLGWPRPC